MKNEDEFYEADRKSFLKVAVVGEESKPSILIREKNTQFPFPSV